MKNYSTGEIAKLLGVRLERIIYMERVGKIPPAERIGGRRVYQASDLTRLRLLLRGDKAARRKSPNVA